MRGYSPAAWLQGFRKDQISSERFMNLRYDGTDVPVMTSCASRGSFAQVGAALAFDRPKRAVLQCSVQCRSLRRRTSVNLASLWKSAPSLWTTCVSGPLAGVRCRGYVRRQSVDSLENADRWHAAEHAFALSWRAHRGSWAAARARLAGQLLL